MESKIKRSVLVIAEGGVNHNGSIERAKKMVEVAFEAGADIIKFQTFKAEDLVTKEAQLASYQQINTGNAEASQFEMLKKLEISQAGHDELIAHAKKIGIRFFSTAFDLASVRYLRTLDLGLWKIPSGEITHLPYLQLIASFGQPTILSTGMSDLAEVSAAVKALLSSGLSKDLLTVLHCNTEYPTPLSDVNLRAMEKMGREFGLAYGYSDHTAGIEVSIAAVALGASVIEKHFTLDKSLPGPDHKASLEPSELKQMISCIRGVEMALGLDKKIVSDSEKKNRQIARKSLVAGKSIRKGEVFTQENVTCKRPGSGISPMRIAEVLGTTAQRDYSADELIEL